MKRLIVEVYEITPEVEMYRVHNEGEEFDRDEAVRVLRATADDLEKR